MGKATITSDLRLGRSEVLRAWDTTCRLKAKDTTPLIAWRREALKDEALDDLPWFLKGRERAIINQMKIGTVSKATLEEILERRGGAHMGFSERIDTILNQTEPKFNHKRQTIFEADWTMNINTRIITYNKYVVFLSIKPYAQCLLHDVYITISSVVIQYYVVYMACPTVTRRMIIVLWSLANWSGDWKFFFLKQLACFDITAFEFGGKNSWAAPPNILTDSLNDFPAVRSPFLYCCLSREWSITPEWQRQRETTQNSPTSSVKSITSFQYVNTVLGW